MILPLRVFGSSGVKTMFAGFAIGPIFFADVVAELLEHLDRALRAALERHVGDDRLPRARVGAAADGRLGDLRVVDERALDLDRRDPVAGDVHHVVDAAEQPEVAVLVDPRAVAGEVDVAVARPVRLAVALVVPVDPAQHRRPRALEHEVAAAARPDLVRPARRRPPARPPGTASSPSRASCVVTPGSGVIRIIPVSVCHQVSTIGQRPPPMCSRYQTHASGLIGSPTVPSSRSEERSCFAACSGPHFMCARIAVGAV